MSTADSNATSANRNLIYDVGMHKGEDTAYYLEKGFQVVAFEADPGLVAAARSAFKDAIAEQRLVLVEGVITEASLLGEPGRTATFYRNDALSVWGTAEEAFAERSRQDGYKITQVDVAVVDLPGTLKTYGVPYYMKIDIEGMDWVCLEALAALETSPAYVSIESEKESFGRLVAEIETLEKLGYTSYQAVQQFLIPGRHAPVPSSEGVSCAYCFPDNASGVFGGDLPADAWLGKEEIINRYYDIFLMYRRFGDHSLIGRYAWSRNLTYSLSRLLRRPLPGWYDTHARHQSFAQQQHATTDTQTGEAS